MENTLILKTIVGSRAHGLHNEDSDHDYRGVFVVPTEEILKVNPKVKTTSWIEGKDDNTSWEIGHFLHMAIRCNPTILEVFHAPTLLVTEEGERLQRLFDKVWSTKAVRDSFIGYCLSQRKKFLEDKDNRCAKYAVAYLRTLCNAYDLLSTGTFKVNMKDHPEFETLKNWKAGKYEVGEVVEKCLYWQNLVEGVADQMVQKETDIDAVNEFLLKLRRDYFLNKNYA